MLIQLEMIGGGRNTKHPILATQSVVHGPVAAASPGSPLKMLTLRPIPDILSYLAFEQDPEEMHRYSKEALMSKDSTIRLHLLS